MSRPKKQTVDYFPHKCTQGRVMLILEQEFKNDGYAFRYKLQEVLGLTDGHFLDCRNAATWRFLTAKTLCPSEMATNILNLLCELGEIDAELWKIRVVWSESFLQDISDAYRNRIITLPTRPAYLLNKQASDGVSDVRNPQRKGKERKGKERKGDDGEPPSPPDWAISKLKNINLLKDICMADKKWIADTATELSIDPKEVSIRMGDFIRHLETDRDFAKTEKDFAGHFKNWFRIKNEILKNGKVNKAGHDANNPQIGVGAGDPRKALGR